MRQTTGSMICPHCSKLISVSEQRCPFCGAWNPSLYGYAPALQKLFGRQLDIVPLIVITCVVLYITALALQPEGIFDLRSPLQFLSPGTRALYQLGMTSRLAMDQHWWWTLLTAIYLHGGLLHIFFNVLWIRNLGPAASEIYGPARAFVIFSIAGAAGFLVSNLVSGGPTIGASGSIFGLMAALIVYGRKRGISMLTAQLWQWAAITFVMGFVLSGVNNWAHAGGFAGGWLTATAMRFDDEKRESVGVQILALLLFLATAAGFVLSFIRVTGLILFSR